MILELSTYGSKGMLRIQGNSLETKLFLKGEPIQYSWYAERGTTIRYHMARGMNKNELKISCDFQELLKQGINDPYEFSILANHFLTFLEYGQYRFGYYSLFKEIGLCDFEETMGLTCYAGYGGCYELKATQRHFDQKIVQQYKEHILKGNRPIVVLIHVERSAMFFVLDGHHKLLAYRAASTAPVAMVITKLGTTETTVEQTKQVMQQMGSSEEWALEAMVASRDNPASCPKSEFELDQIFTRIQV